MKLSLSDIRVHRDGRTILGVDRLTLGDGEFTAVLGHNGSGKSTLMQIMARQMKPDQGVIHLDGQPLERYGQRDLARRMAFLPQQLPEVAGLDVRELVRLGRFPWRGLVRRWQSGDAMAVDWALEQTGMGEYATHLVDELSGGERQRAWIAMLLAQEAPLLLLDEPTSALDLSHQYECMALLRGLNRSAGRGVVVILHDVNLAARYADRVIALKHGEVAFDGTPDAMLSPNLLSTLYGIDINLIAQPGTQRPVAVVA
ncbi:ABC transporter [Halovibrio salipaludis]|uniref:ABC transporter n=1 Tax=Halovibrio salipaludis TaxID=2032626 RepID=A0A2A2FB08_9GAMM|nr:ABC transporter ATP-binding protein [Halovibrio salipaludis]PAU81733.1 ABC transporter [Halovibrio salipaludis]